jgi:hypothetical protein
MFISDRPSPPEGPLAITDVTRESVRLAWSLPLDDGGSAITHYVVEKMDVTRGSWTEAATTGLTSGEFQQ